MVRATRVTNTLREIRDRSGLTQAEVAARVGVTRQTLIAIEQGKYSPTLELAFRLCNVYGVRIDDAFTYPEEES